MRTTRTLVVFLLIQPVGCIVDGGSRSVVRNELNGVDTIRVSANQIELDGELLNDGSSVMQWKGQPARTAVLCIGDSVNLPIFNGTADYRLEAISNEVLLFTGDLWYWACIGPFLIHHTEHLALVRNDQQVTENETN